MANHSVSSSACLLTTCAKHDSQARAGIVFLFVGIITTAVAHAAPVNVSDLVFAKQFATNIRPAVSPDGLWVAYTLTQKATGGDTLPSVATTTLTGVSYQALGGSIFLTSIKTADTRQLTSGEAGSSWGPLWSPDGRFLAFLSDVSDGTEDKRAHVWVWEQQADRLRRVSDAAVRGGLEWTPDSSQLLVRLLPSSMLPELSGSDVPNPSVSPGPSGTTATVYRAQPKSTLPTMISRDRLDAMRGGLALISVEDGQIRRLFQDEAVAASALSPDGQHVLVTLLRDVAGVGSFRRKYDLVVLTPTASNRVTLVADVMLVSDDAVRWAPDSGRIVYKTADGVFVIALTDGRSVGQASHEFGWGIDRDNRTPGWLGSSQALCYTTDNRVLWALDAGAAPLDSASQASARQVSTQPRKLAEFPESFVELITRDSSRVWSPSGNDSIGVYVHSFATNRNGIYAIALKDGTVTRLMETDRSLGSANVPFGMAISSSDNSIVYLSESAHEPPDLWIADRQFHTDRRLTHANPQLDALSFGRSRIITWQAPEGATLHGALLLPPDYQRGKRYPLVVWVYGGVRQSRDANRFGLSRNPMFNQQMLATRGYAVFLPDAPQQHGEPVASLVRAVLPGVERVVEDGFADPDRIGLAGHSYGGYSALALLTRTTRFKAAVASAGLYNLTSVYLGLSPDGSSPGLGVADAGRLFINGTLWDEPELFIENSPVMHLDKVTAPLLLLHGAADEATRPTESEQVFVGLRRLGKPVEYVRYAGETHLISQLPNQEDYWRRIVEWFERYLAPSR